MSSVEMCVLCNDFLNCFSITFASFNSWCYWNRLTEEAWHLSRTDIRDITASVIP